MKKSNFIIPLALAFVLAGCAGGGEVSSASSSSSSSSSSASSSVDENAKKDLTIADLEAEVASYSSKAASVASGSFTKKVDSLSEGEGEPATTTYDFGTDVYHYADNSGDVYVVKDDDSYIGIKKDTEGDYSVLGTSFESANYHFKEYIGDYNTAYGVEGLLADLLTAMKSANAKDFSAYSENGKIYFSFGYLYFDSGDPEDYFIVSGSFPKYANAVLTDWNLAISDYYWWGFDYDSDTKEVTIKEDKTADQTTTFSFVQTAGERTYVNPLDLSKFCYSSFDLTYWDDDEEKTVTSSTVINMKTGDYIGFDVANALPATALSDYDQFTGVIVEGDKEGLTISSYGESISIYAETSGDYKVKVTTKNCSSATFSIKVTAPAPRDIGIDSRITWINGGYTDAPVNDDDDIIAVIGATYYIAPSVLPYNAAQGVSYTVSLDGEDAASSAYTIETANIDMDDEGSGKTVYLFTPLVSGAFSITFVSSTLASVTRTVNIIASEGSFATMLSKSYTASYYDYGTYDSSIDDYTWTNYDYSFSFEPSADDIAKGSATISYKSSNYKNEEASKSEVVNYEIKKNDANGLFEFSFTHASGDEGVASGLGGLVIDKYYTGIYVEFSASDGYTGLMAAETPTFDDNLFNTEWYGRVYEDELDDGSPDTESYWYDFYISFTSAHRANGEIWGQDDEEATGTLFCAWSLKENDDGDGYIITFDYIGEDDMGDDPTDFNYVFDELPATATVDSDFSSINVTATGYYDQAFVLAQENDGGDDTDSSIDDNLYGTWYMRYYEDELDDGEPDTDGSYYDFTLRLTDAHMAFGNIYYEDDDEASGTLKCAWSVEADDDDGYTITFTYRPDDEFGDNDTEFDGVFTELPTTATVDSDFSSITVTTTDCYNYIFVLTPNVAD